MMRRIDLSREEWERVASQLDLESSSAPTRLQADVAAGIRMMLDASRARMSLTWEAEDHEEYRVVNRATRQALGMGWYGSDEG